MNSRERFLTALKGGIPDRVPVSEYLFSLKLQKEVMGYNTVLYEGETQVKMAAKLGLDVDYRLVRGDQHTLEPPSSPRSTQKN